MDYGDDPVLSAMYAKENSAAVQMMSPTGLSLLQSLKERRSWYKKSLDELRDKLVTPAMMVAAGMKWPALQSKYGASALISFGFSWEDMLATGFDGRALRSMTPDLLSRIGVNATRALQCRPRAEDVAALSMTPLQMTNMGWTLDMLKAIGLNHANMIQFRMPLHTWVTTFHLTDFASLGFSTYSACAAAGWLDADIQLALSNARAAPASRKSARADTELKFI